MSARFSATLAGAVCLVGLCACKPQSPARWQHHYTLNAPTAATPTPVAEAAGESPLTLRIDRIGAPNWLQTVDMHYRLLYQDDTRLRSYTLSRWASPPPQLLQELIQNALASNGAWHAVVGPDANAQVERTLRLHLTDFEQDFSSADDSYAHLAARATLVDADGNVLAQREFDVQQPAASPDADGGAQAMGQAAQRFAAELAQWLIGTGPSGSRDSSAS